MVAVFSSNGTKLMPTSNFKARKLINKGRAIIFKHGRLFAIKLLDRETGDTQPIEYASDTGYLHVGVSIKSTKHEYVDAEYQLLKDEVERHNDCRKYRRTRRNRLRYRKCRFDNRRIPNGWLAPSLKNKLDTQIQIFEDYLSIFPITTATFELGQFDTQLLKALEEGNPLPEGSDYQKGEQYQIATLREAVFYRDDYTCQICKQKGVILRVHHIGYYKKDRTNRLGNLLTVCDKCHTPKNHQPSGALYGLKPKHKPLTGASFMTSIRWQMINTLKSSHPEIDINFQYGAKTKQTRQGLNITKSHSNDAYCIGKLRPRHRIKQITYIKQRRNNRILSKFYDAKYIDLRDGQIRTGKELFNGRTNRNHKTDTENLHKYRGQKISKGRVSLRTKHYSYRPKDLVLYEDKKYEVLGVQNSGKYIKLSNKAVVRIDKVNSLRHCNGWSLQI